MVRPETQPSGDLDLVICVLQQRSEDLLQRDESTRRRLDELFRLRSVGIDEGFEVMGGVLPSSEVFLGCSFGEHGDDEPRKGGGESKERFEDLLGLLDDDGFASDGRSGERKEDRFHERVEGLSELGD